MRLSVLESDPGFRRDSWRYVVFLDGAKLDRCVTADDQTGVVECITPCAPGDRWPRHFSMRGAVRIERQRSPGWPTARTA